MQKIIDSDILHAGVICIRNNFNFTYYYFHFDYYWELKSIIRKYTHIKRDNKYVYKLVFIHYNEI